MAISKIINQQDEPMRADILLASNYPKYSRAALAKLFDLDKITQTDKPIKAGDKIKPQESIQADISPLNKPVNKIDLPIIFEDQDVVVIDKPVGVISHARGRFWDEASVASFIRDKIDDIDGERAGIVHRLDRATSGIMICAKNQSALKFLQSQFSKRKVQKTYIAIVDGKPPHDQAIIDVPIARNPKKPQTFMANSDGKLATTKYKVLSSNKSKSLLLLQPATGRTHQLRVHLKYIGFPILGDDLYNGNPAKRLFLHAYSLKIQLPDGSNQIFFSPLPQEFLQEIGYAATFK